MSTEPHIGGVQKLACRLLARLQCLNPKYECNAQPLAYATKYLDPSMPSFPDSNARLNRLQMHTTSCMTACICALLYLRKATGKLSAGQAEGQGQGEWDTGKGKRGGGEGGGYTCKISLDTLRGRSELSTTPLMKDRYRGIKSSSNSSLMKTRLTNSLMLRLRAMASCTKHQLSLTPLCVRSVFHSLYIELLVCTTAHGNFRA